MSVLKIKNDNGEWEQILTIKGDKGDKGDTYELTQEDKEEIADMTTVQDVQIDGNSVVTDGVAEIPIGSKNNLGVAKYNSSFGVTIIPQTGMVALVNPTDAEIKNGTTSKGILVARQHQSTFYGLAKAAGHDEKDSELPVGQYTDEAKSSIQDMLDVPSNDEMLSAYPVKLASGAIASFVDGADDIPLKSLVVGIEPSQDTSGGDPSPTNICPISGWTGMSGQACGKNLFDASVCTVEETYLISDTGEITANNGYAYTTSYTKVNAGTTYTLSGTITSGSMRPSVAFYDANKTFISRFLPASGVHEPTFTTPANTEYIRWNMSRTAYNLSTIQLEEGSSATTYESYTGTDISIQFGQTVYGGTLDVLTGVLTVTHGIVTLTSSMSWYSGYYGYYTQVSDMHANSDNFTSVKCSHFATLESADTGSGIYCTSIAMYFRRINSDYATKSDWTTFLDENAVKVVYPLATPTTVQLTAQEVSSLLGDNNIFADCGDTTIEYRADPKTYIDDGDKVSDVQIDGSSIVTDGVAEIPIADQTRYGTVKFYSGVNGLRNSNGFLISDSATSSDVKTSTHAYKPITPKTQHESTFYGLAKVSGDTTQSQSSNSVGNYTDNAKDKIQTMLGVSPLIASHESDPFESAHEIGELFIIDGKLYRTKTALMAGEYVNEGTNVEVVSVAGVLDDTYIKNTDIAGDNYGLVKLKNGDHGLGKTSSGFLQVYQASIGDIKTGTQVYRPIVPNHQHLSTFYGLAKAAGDTTQSVSSNEVGTYTSEAKTAIKTMLGVSDETGSVVVEETGTDLTITAEPNYRYVCGELLTLNFTPSSSGICEVIFTSGSTPTVLTLPDTVKMPDWWIDVEANYTYEICITDGVYGAVMSWAT